MEEHLLTALIVAPFFITMVGFAVAIAFAPAVPNEIAPATEHDHEEEAAGIEFIDENGGGAGLMLKKRAKAVKEISRQIDALEDKISSIPSPTEPSPEAAINTMRKAVAKNNLKKLKNRRTRITRRDRSK